MRNDSILTLQNALEKGKTTSRQLVNFYLKRIATYDESLNSLADLNHEAYAIADALDEERKTIGVRSLLHGIPIVVKDNIFTNDSMRTTANSFALKDFYAPFDATIIKKLRDAGAIILAKANCSEFAYFMAMGKMPSGYGSMHGQVKHPFNLDVDPLGSSTGSAVAVAADLAVASIGTETNGSLMSPAQQNSVVSIKPTIGHVSRHGIIPITYLQDTAGPMSKTVKDAAIMLDIIKGMDEEDTHTYIQPKETSYLEACETPVDNLKVGILNFKNYKFDDEEEKIIEEAKIALEDKGVVFVPIDFEYALPNNLIPMVHEFKRDFNAFFARLKPYAPITSLKDLIDFNDSNPHRNLKHGQSIFRMAETTDGRLKSHEYLTIREKTKNATDTFERLFEEHEIDAIMTTKINGYSAVAGLPSLIIPAKKKQDLQPRSLLFIGKKFSEPILFSLGFNYEQLTNHRIIPDLEIHKK